jgi:hypothetical protein
MQQVGWLACDRRGYPRRQRRVANWLQEVVNRSGLSVAEVRAVTAAVVDRGPIAPGDLCGTTPAVTALLCGRGDAVPPAAIDVAELAGALTPLAQLAYLRACDVAACTVDFDVLDWGAVARDLQAAEPDPAVRFVGALRLRALRGKLDQRAAAWNAAARAAARAAYTAWSAKLSPPDRALVTDAARVLRGDKAACAGVETGLARAIEQAAPTTGEAAAQLWQQPVPNVAWHARLACVGFEAGVIQRMLRTVGWLGPRALADRATHPYPGFSQLMEGPRVAIAEDRTETLRLTIDRADGARLAFRPARWSEANYECVETRRVDRITDDGRIKYRELCKQTGTTAMREQFQPVEVTNRHAPFARDQVVVYATERPSEHVATQANEAPRTWTGAPPLPAIVLEQYDARGRLIAYWGVPLVR